MEDHEIVTVAIEQDLKKRKRYKNPLIYNFNCECGKNFNFKKHYNAHRRAVHNEPKSSLNISENNPKNHCPLCDFSAKFREEMIKHFELVHNITFVVEKHTFSTQDEFFMWKRKMESDTLSKFSSKGTQSFANHKITNFYCHRSGCYIRKGKGLRSLKKQGSNKMNSFCPAKIVLKCLNDGTCIVQFCGVHVGHQNELKYLTLTAMEKEELAKKISLKIPFNDILDEIRDSMDCSLQRIHLLTRKDLHNIEAAYNLHSQTVRHKDDAKSVDDWVKEMKSEGSCILFYKSQGICLDNFPYLKAEDFVLIIMTEAQLNILRKYGNDCICLDGTDGLNNEYVLNSLLVLDELRGAFPCAFLISNRSDTEVLTLFFERIRDKVDEPLKSKVFMSDLEDTFFNAWVSIMGVPEKRLFCTWHVDRSWRKNLNKIKSRDTQLLIYKHLRTMLTERDPNSFHIMLDEFCEIDDLECTDFIIYFREYYATNYEYWAYCYRPHADINTNMNLERMHRSINYIFLKGKNSKSLDKGIAAIMRYIRCKLIDRANVNNKGKISSKIANIKSRHRNMEKMNPTNFIQSDDGWEVLSENCEETYLIQKQETDCEDCQIVCVDCDICIHQFQCSCLDSAIKYNMCKHIHLVASSIKDTDLSGNIVKGEEEIGNYLVVAEYPSVSDSEFETYEQSKNSPCQDLAKRKEKLQNALMHTLDAVSTVEEIEIMEEMYAQVSTSLAAIRSNELPTSFQIKENIVIKIVPQEK